MARTSCCLGKQQDNPKAVMLCRNPAKLHKEKKLAHFDMASPLHFRDNSTAPASACPAVNAWLARPNLMKRIQIAHAKRRETAIRSLFDRRTHPDICTPAKAITYMQEVQMR
jgi:hypothetical protein